MVDEVTSEAVDTIVVFLDKLYETTKQFVNIDNLVHRVPALENIQVNKLIDEQKELEQLKLHEM